MQILTDENAILQYLDERYGARRFEERGGLPPDSREQMAAAMQDAERHGQALCALAAQAHHDGDVDLANVLTVAAIDLLEAAGWLRKQLN